MYIKFFCCTLFVIFSLATFVLYQGYTESWPDNDELPSSLYASTHGYKNWFNKWWWPNGHTKAHAH